MVLDQLFIWHLRELLVKVSCYCVVVNMMDCLQPAVIPKCDIVWRLFGPAISTNRAKILIVLSDKAAPRCFYGHLYEDGSFTASGELELSGDYEKTVQFQMHNIRKDAFYTAHLGLNNMSDYMQWNYTTADGYTALLALSDRTGLIFVENEGCFVSIIIEEVPDEGIVFTGLPKEKPFLEMVCDCFMFSDLENG